MKATTLRTAKLMAKYTKYVNEERQKTERQLAKRARIEDALLEMGDHVKHWRESLNKALYEWCQHDTPTFSVYLEIDPIMLSFDMAFDTKMDVLMDCVNKWVEESRDEVGVLKIDASCVDMPEGICTFTISLQEF
jgi:hypothetical protein